LIREAMRSIEEGGIGTAFLTEDDGTLVGTVTDGDIRRGLLTDVDLDEPVSVVANEDPITIEPGWTSEQIRKRVDLSELKGKATDGRLIVPVVEDGRLVDVSTLAVQGDEPVRDPSLSFASPVIASEELSQVKETIESGWLTTGPKTEQFETKLGELVGAGHTIGVSNCSSALYLAYRALDVEGKIITTPLTFATTVSAARLAGATPVLADIRPDTLTLDPEAVKEAITPQVDAIAPVHYAGQGTDIDLYRDLAADHDLAIVEDAAHALGGQFEGEELGTIGDVGCYSFYATKSITTGEGGALVTDDDDVAQTVRQLRLAGIDSDPRDRKAQEQPDWYYDVKRTSSKFNMTDLQAAIGLAQLDKLDDFISTRQQLANTLDQRLTDIEGVRPLAVRDSDEHARHIYPIVLDTETIGISRNEFDRRLGEEGIETSVHYIPIHHHTAFAEIERGDLSTTEDIHDRILSIPLHPQMNEADVDDIVAAIDRAVTSSVYL
jgi:dTDP-4-amino-4,6-dideoxygalactose transaminase